MKNQKKIYFLKRKEAAGYITLIALLCVLLFRLFEILFLGHRLFYSGYFLLLPALWLSCSLLIDQRSPLEAFRKASLSGLAILLLPWAALLVQTQLFADVFFFDSSRWSAHSHLTFSVSYGSTWFLIGLCVATCQRELPWQLTLIFVVAAALMVLINVNGGTIDYLELRARANDASLSHIFINESLVILLFVACASIENVNFRIGLALLCLAVLAMVGGRTALVVFGLTIVVFEIFFTQRPAWKQIIVITISFTSVLIGIRYVAEMTSDEGLLALFNLNDLRNDRSFTERGMALEIGLQNLWSQWGFGNAALTASLTGGVGSYIHNLLSAWQYFGLPFFCLICFVFGKGLWHIHRNRRIKAYSQTFFAFRSYVLIYAVLAGATSLSILSSTIWFGLGMAIVSRGGSGNLNKVVR